MCPLQIAHCPHLAKTPRMRILYIPKGGSYEQQTHIERFATECRNFSLGTPS